MAFGDEGGFKFAGVGSHSVPEGGGQRREAPSPLYPGAWPHPPPPCSSASSRLCCSRPRASRSAPPSPGVCVARPLIPIPLRELDFEFQA